MKYFFFALILSASALAQIRFEQVFNRGEGCPRGSMTAVPSPDGSSISFLFDAFQVEVPSRVPGRTQLMDKKHCNIRFSSVLPEGTEAYALDISVNARGFANIQPGVRGALVAQLEAITGLAPLSRPVVIARKEWSSTREISDEYTITPKVNIPLPSRCSSRAMNRMEFSLTTLAEAQILSRDTSRSGTIVVDSVDTSGLIKVTLKTRSCRANLPPIRR